MIESVKDIKCDDRAKVIYYVCDWCGHKFTKSVRKSGTGKGKRGAVSTQVVCPRCKHFIETWR